MPAPVTIDGFLELGFKSGLLERETVQTCRSNWDRSGTQPQSPKELADALIKEGVLTHFQAEGSFRSGNAARFRRLRCCFPNKTKDHFDRNRSRGQPGGLRPFSKAFIAAGRYRGTLFGPGTPLHFSP